MSVPQPPTPAKLIAGFLVKDRSLAGEIAGRLQERLGPVETISAWLNFDFTRYYQKEMGAPLSRRLLVFRPLVEQTQLALIKCMTNAMEDRYRREGQRQVNIDPGYLLPERFVLGSGKNFTHRIYIGRGIYADLTLIYQKGAFRQLPWTYPDYADGQLLAFLTQVRRRYMQDLKRHRDGKIEDSGPLARIE